MSIPTITLLSRDNYDARYRIEGGDLADQWASGLRSGRVAWCEITIRNGSDYLGSFGGEVWPGAWPALFECGKGTAQTGPWTRVTAAGRAALDAALPERRRCRHCDATLGTTHDPICIVRQEAIPHVTIEWCTP